MDEPTDGRNRFIAFIVIVATIIGVVYFMRQPSTREAIDETVDAFVPAPEQFERRMGSIDEARRVTDLINARQTRADDE